MWWLRVLRLLPRITSTVEQLQVKAWWQSKTIWLNLIVTAAAVAAAIGGARFDVPPDAAAAIAGGVVAVINIGLRVLTKKPVGLRGVPAAPRPGHDDDVQNWIDP